MNGWEVALAVASAAANIAAALVVGVPALAHHGVVPHGVWLAGVLLVVAAAVLLLSSCVLSVVDNALNRREYLSNAPGCEDNPSNDPS